MTVDVSIIISRLEKLRDDLLLRASRINKLNNGATSGGEAEVAESWAKVKDIIQELTFLNNGIDYVEKAIAENDASITDIVRQRNERDKQALKNKLRAVVRIENEANTILNQPLPDKKEDKEELKKEEPEKEEKKPEKPKKEPEPARPKQKAVLNPEKEPTTPGGSFKKVLSTIDDAIDNFNKRIPDAQHNILDGINEELRRLDLKDGNIKTTVANLKVIQSIKNKLSKLILTDDYLKDVNEFVKSFNTVSALQNEYWKAAESKFKPTPLLKQIRLQAIGDTVQQLTEAGIGANIGDRIAGILRTNITSGGSYKALNAQLLESLTDTEKSDGLLTKYSKQVTTDSIQQYNRSYTQQAAAGLGFEWFAYQGSDIKTTRPFCDAMTDLRYFHISEIPRLLRAEDLYYMKDGAKTKVPIYEKTGLPAGMIEGTNPENFFIRAGGHRCGHAIRPVPERNVPLDYRDRVYNTIAYQRWKSNNE